MKAIVPLAGKGTRLLPATRYVPKPLLPVAGRPVLDHVMTTLSAVDIDELIFITGHLKEQVEEHVRATYDVPARFVEQRVQDGTAGAVQLARPFVDGPVLIVFVDTLFDADLSIVRTLDGDGIIWAQEVDDYQRYGVVVTDDDGYMTRIVEKPSTPVSRLANIGLYYIAAWEALFEGIDATLAAPANRGEWYLTDAFQHMIDHGARLKAAEVAGWYDCGKMETMLTTNAHLLGRMPQPSRVPSGVTQLDPPVSIHSSAVLSGARIGPNVSIGEGAEVRDSSIQNAIVCPGAQVRDSELEDCFIGPGAEVVGHRGSRVIAAGGEIAPAP